MAELTREELAALLETVDELCRQSQELQRQIREKIKTARRQDQPAQSDAKRK